MLKVGEIAPDFSLPDHEGVEVKLSELSGKWVAIWWFVKSLTPG